MRQLFMGLTLAVACHIGTTRADELLYSYEGDILPVDAGWYGRECEPPCFPSIEDGHFVMRFIGYGSIVDYSHIIAYPDEPPPPTLWIEWNFRSNTRFTNAFGCDAAFKVQYRELSQTVDLFGDGVFSREGSDYVLGLRTSEFHTHRFESTDGENYTFAVDGEVFIDSWNLDATNASFIDMRGLGECLGDQVNEWDFVRYGTIGAGEQVVAVDPPPGTLTASEGAQFRSFNLTFDKPAYLYIDDIAVSTTGSAPPDVSATKRLDNGAPEVLQVFVAGQLPPGETTTFTFDTGAGPQDISYFREQPEIPATSEWGIVMMALLSLVAGSAVFRRHEPETA